MAHVDPSGKQPPQELDDLQFEEAEYSGPQAQRTLPLCSHCQEEIPDSYYLAAGNVLCEPCRDGIEAAFRGGSKLTRVLKATALGGGAAILGAIIYYAILRGTDYNIGLVAILTGLMVGAAVRAGSGNRGGLGYQFLALFLTYSSIAFALLPLAVEQSLKARFDAAKPAAVQAGAQPGAKAALGAPGQEQANAQPADKNDVNPLVAMATLLGFVLVGTYSMPILFGIVAPINGLIFAFGLWEAWRRNKGVTLAFEGPFAVGSGAPGGVDHAG